MVIWATCTSRAESRQRDVIRGWHDEFTAAACSPTMATRGPYTKACAATLIAFSSGPHCGRMTLRHVAIARECRYGFRCACACRTSEGHSMDVTTARRVSVLQVASSAHSLQSLNRCPALHHTFTRMPAARSDRLDRSRTIQVLASLIQHSSHRLPAPATTSCNKPHAAPTAPHSARVCESQQSRMCGVHEPRRAEARTCSAAIDLGPPRCLPMCPRPSWPYEFSPNVSSSPRSALQSPAQVQERAPDANRSGAAPGWTCEDRRVRCAAGDSSASVDRQPLRLQTVCHVG
jgi:hypothetical protein